MKFALVISLLALSTEIVSASEPASPAMSVLIKTLSKTEDPASELNILRGVNAALKGKRDLSPPGGWSELYEKLKGSPNEEVRQQAQTLAVVFGGGNALEEVRTTLADPKAPVERRKSALDSVVTAKDSAALPALLQIAVEAGPLRRAAIHGLAAYDDPKIPQTLLAAYPAFTTDEKREALSTLVNRPAWAHVIIDGLESKVIARADVSTPVARQLSELKDPQITDWLAKNWGAMRSSPADKQAQIARLKSVLTPAFMAKGDASHGRALFTQTCALCHTLFGYGAKIGPELPGAFEDIDYLLLNIIDPNAIIGKDYQQTVVETKDGQTLVGIIGEQDASSVTLKSLAGLQTVQRPDISKLTVLETSLMPEGLLTALKDEDVRDLFSYLRLHGQTPLLATPLNVSDFFNGVDLSKWIPSRADAWRVDQGEIVGRGNGDRPEFLTSDMTVESFRLTAKFKVSHGSAEAAFRGQQTDGGFVGCAVRFGSGPVSLLRYELPSRPVPEQLSFTIPENEWTPCEIIAEHGLTTVTFAGQPKIEVKDGPGMNRTVFTFSVAGAGSELRIKDLHLELR